MEKDKILLVEDHESVRNLCARVLASQSYEVTPSSSGDLARELLGMGSYDLMITDLEMPGSINGVKLLEEAKRVSPSMDVIIITAYPSLDSALPALREGAFDYLIKPLDIEKFKSVVHHCLESKKFQSELNQEQSMKLELEAAYSELRKMDQLKEAFIARVSDELKTPLTLTLPALEMINKEQLDPKNKQLFEFLRLGLEQLKEIIENLLLFSKEVRQEIKLNRVPTQIERILNTLIENYKIPCKKKQITVHLVMNSKMSSVLVDPSYIAAAFKHLFLNAIHFSKPGGTINIELAKVDGRFTVAFVDHGIGIPKEEISNIFDGFYQVAHYLTRQVKGIGLGLAITKRIVEAHGGYITVKSSPENGSTFTICLSTE